MAATTSNTLRGLSTINAVVLMGCPRVIQSRTIELNVEIYLGQPNVETLFGVVRYYNKNDIVFDEEATLYMIEATVGSCLVLFLACAVGSHPFSFYRCLNKAESFLMVAQNMTSSEISYGYGSSLPDYMHALTLMTQAIPLGDSIPEPFHRPYVHLSGLASNCNQEAGNWTINIEPYVSATIKTEAGEKPSVARPRAPFFCQHTEAHGRRKKPTPYNNRFVAVQGYITDVIYKPGSETVECFKVLVDCLEFLGAEPTSSSAVGGGRIANKLDSECFYLFSFMDQSFEPPTASILQIPLRLHAQRDSVGSSGRPLPALARAVLLPLPPPRHRHRP